ncbi:MAG: helix-turn-helix domain-containing protein [Deltaproteobacteria bacterium]
MPAAAQRLSTEERHRQLLERGLDLFARHSFDQLSTDQIAKEAGVSKALLFHYFGSKRGYYVATIQEVAARVAAATAPDPSLPFEPALKGALEGYVDFVKHHGALYASLVRGGVGADDEVHGILDVVRKTSVDLVVERAEIRRPSARLLAALEGWVAFTETTTLRWHADRGFSERVLVRLLMDTLLALLERELRSKR